MTPERYDRIMEVFLQASQHRREARAKFIEKICREDHDLRREVQSMIAADERADEFLEESADDIAADLLNDCGASIVGQKLGEYEVIKLLGVGGMGEVFLAQDTQLGRRAALKILPEEYTVDPLRRSRFEEEARAIAALNHPNIMTIYGIGQAGCRSFLATEFVEGETLRAMLEAGPLSAELVIDIAVQATAALAAAHSAGIVHRDIKPENMILRLDGLLKILDFGQAERPDEPAVSGSVLERLQSQSSPGLIVGTPRYMSPEQARGLTVDSRTDVFSLGCVLYELLTGYPAIAVGELSGGLAAIFNQQPTPITTLRPNCPAALVRIVERALEKHPDKRYLTAKEMLADLRAVQHEMNNGDLVPASGHRLRTTVGATALVLVALVTAIYLVTPRGSIESIAVLPFVNEGGAQLEFLADGLTDSLIGDLSEVPKLKVISRSSVFLYKNRQVDPALAGGILKAQAVLFGRVSQRGDRLLVRLELVNVRDNRRVWGEQYNRIWADLLQMQVEISREVLSKLRVTVTGDADHQLSRRWRVKPEAYRLYLKGQFLLSRAGTESDLRSAMSYLYSALDKDPRYALAAVGIANGYVALADYASPREAMPKAREYALKAIELPGARSEGHVALGLVKLLYDWDFLGAEKEFKNDSPLTPKAVSTFSCYLHYTDTLGRTQEAIASLNRLLAHDPMSVWNNAELGCVSYYARQYDKSLALSRRTVGLNPEFQLSYVSLGRAYIQKQMYPEAVAELQKGRRLDPEFPLIVAELGYAWAASGNKAAAQHILDELNQIATHRYVDAYLIALIYLGSNDREKAFFYLEKAYAERSSSMPWLKVEPKFDVVRSDSRYLDLLRRVGFPI
jgi:serine/threonine protein kinase/tetratricopeptide (TPR) repeat protein